MTGLTILFVALAVGLTVARVCVRGAALARAAALAVARVDRWADRVGVRLADHHGDWQLDRQAQRPLVVPAGGVVRDPRGGDRAADRDAGGGDLRGTGAERDDARPLVCDPRRA